MAAICAEAGAVFLRCPRTGSTWTGAVLQSEAVEAKWAERGAQHHCACELPGYTTPWERKRTFTNVRETIPWLRSVYRWGTKGGNWEPLPGVASLLWPTSPVSWGELLEMHAELPLVDAVVEGFTRGVTFVLRTSGDLAGDLCTVLSRLGIAHDEAAIRAEPRRGVTKSIPKSLRGDLEVPDAVAYAIQKRNPLATMLAKTGRGV